MKQKNPCPISGCDHNILPTSKYGVCGRHTEILAAFDWYLDKLAKGTKPEHPQERSCPAKRGEATTKGSLALVAKINPQILIVVRCPI